MKFAASKANAELGLEASMFASKVHASRSETGVKRSSGLLMHSECLVGGRDP